MTLDFRSMVIAEITGNISEEEEEYSDGEYYVLVCEECKQFKVTPPTTEEWTEFMKFIRWHNEVLGKIIKERNRII